MYLHLYISESLVSVNASNVLSTLTHASVLWATLRQFCSLPHLFHRLFFANIYYLAVVWKRNLRRACDSPPSFQVRISTEFQWAVSLTNSSSIFVGLLLWNYFLCVFTDPGRVPTGWVRFGGQSCSLIKCQSPRAEA